MAFDSNPQAVYHGLGYPSLVVLDTAEYDLDDASDHGNLIAASSGGLHIADYEDGELLFLQFTHQDIGSTPQIPVQAEDLKVTPATGDRTVTATTSNAASIYLPYYSSSTTAALARIWIGVGVNSGNLTMASAVRVQNGNVTLTVSRMT